MARSIFPRQGRGVDAAHSRIGQVAIVAAHKAQVHGRIIVFISRHRALIQVAIAARLVYGFQAQFKGHGRRANAIGFGICFIYTVVVLVLSIGRGAGAKPVVERSARLGELGGWNLHPILARRQRIEAIVAVRRCGCGDRVAVGIQRRAG